MQKRVEGTVVRVEELPIGRKRLAIAVAGGFDRKQPLLRVYRAGDPNAIVGLKGN
jgi:hypothetical protein